MPFVALKNGEIVTPEEVDDNEVLKCPSCSNLLKPRGSYYRDGGSVFVARHFWHFEREGNGCSGGESYEHQRMKTVALSKLKELFKYSDWGLDSKYIGENKPDAFVEFPEPMLPYGKGVAVEVQYRNKGKDTNSVSQNYYNRGYSVCWLSEEDFHGKNVDLEKNIEKVWPRKAPGHDWDSLNISNLGGQQEVRGTLLFRAMVEKNWAQFVPSSSEWNVEPISFDEGSQQVRAVPPWFLLVPSREAWDNEPIGIAFLARKKEKEILIFVRNYLLSKGKSKLIQGENPIGPKFSRRFSSLGFNSLHCVLRVLRKHKLVNKDYYGWYLTKRGKNTRFFDDISIKEEVEELLNDRPNDRPRPDESNNEIVARVIPEESYHTSRGSNAYSISVVESGGVKKKLGFLNKAALDSSRELGWRRNGNVFWRLPYGVFDSDKDIFWVESSVEELKKMFEPFHARLGDDGDE